MKPDRLQKETIDAVVPIGQMVIDETYQRHVNDAFVRKLAAKWHPDSAGSIILNLRDDGQYAVLDGQHRVRAAALAGQIELPAHCFIGKSREEEARLFVELNTKINVQSMDRFRANLKAGNIPEKNIRRALQEVGLDIQLAGRSPNRVRCTTALLSIYNDDGLPMLKTIAGVLTSAFSSYSDDAKWAAYSAEAWGGMSAFLRRYPGVDVQRLILRLSMTGPSALLGMANQLKRRGSNTAMGWGMAVTKVYNHQLRGAGRLDETLWEKKVFGAGSLQRVKDTGRRNLQQIPKGKQLEGSKKGGRVASAKNQRANGTYIKK